MRSSRERLIRIADDPHVVRGDVRTQFLVNERCSRLDGTLDVDDRREFFPVDDDRLQRILRHVSALGDHHGNRFADVVDLILRQRVAGVWVRQVWMRNKHRHAPLARPDVLVGPDCHHSR
ncbi:hypothetical protein HRbin27_02046 [bacterium HR27]|nr:hypothetical protein HRbin27_02046 [bacterium HR27]